MGGIIKKVMMYVLLGPLAFLMGKFNVMDFIMVPMIAPMLAPMFGGLGLTPGATAQQART